MNNWFQGVVNWFGGTEETSAEELNRLQDSLMRMYNVAKIPYPLSPAEAAHTEQERLKEYNQLFALLVSEMEVQGKINSTEATLSPQGNEKDTIEDWVKSMDTPSMAGSTDSQTIVKLQTLVEHLKDENKRLQAQEETLNLSNEAFSENVRDLSEHTTQLQAELDKRQQECMRLQSQYSQAQGAVQTLEVKLSEMQNEVAKHKKNVIDLVRSIIYYRDRFFTQLAFAKENGPEVAVKIVSGSLAATEKVLTDNGVQILRNIGAFDMNTQEISSTLPTNDPALDGIIVSTEHEGYLLGDGLLRTQQVIVYQYRGE